MTNNAAPTPADKAWARASLWIVGLVVGLPMLVIGGCTVLALTSGPSTSGAEASAIQLCREEVRGQLKSPSSADFSNEFATLASGEATQGAYRVTGSVDADNSFGASIRSSFVCGVTVSKGKATAATAELSES